MDLILGVAEIWDTKCVDTEHQEWILALQALAVSGSTAGRCCSAVGRVRGLRSSCVQRHDPWK